MPGQTLLVLPWRAADLPMVTVLDMSASWKLRIGVVAALSGAVLTGYAIQNTSKSAGMAIRVSDGWQQPFSLSGAWRPLPAPGAGDADQALAVRQSEDGGGDARSAASTGEQDKVPMAAGAVAGPVTPGVAEHDAMRPPPVMARPHAAAEAAAPDGSATRGPRVHVAPEQPLPQPAAGVADQTVQTAPPVAEAKSAAVAGAASEVSAGALLAPADLAPALAVAPAPPSPEVAAPRAPSPPPMPSPPTPVLLPAPPPAPPLPESKRPSLQHEAQPRKAQRVVERDDDDERPAVRVRKPILKPRTARPPEPGPLELLSLQAP